MSDAETRRLEADGRRIENWKRWGPYLSERQWGTVREDYSADGEVWEYFPHEHARSRAYRWGEDRLLGICDRECRLCFAISLWNGRDPILKERLFGLSGKQGNHGEDVKEVYFYLDSTPTHSYMKAIYRYPQSEFPYERLLEENRRRGLTDTEFEIADTGVFEGGRYFDVSVEYAKKSPNDILVRIEVWNRGPDEAPLHILPTLWIRNTWSGGLKTRRAASLGGRGRDAEAAPRRRVRRHAGGAPPRGGSVLCVADPGGDHRGRAPNHAPGVRGASLDEAVLPLLREGLARRGPRPTEAAFRTRARAEPGLGAPLQPRHPLDARLLGVPLVRRVGSRVSHAPPCAARPRI